MRIVAPPWCSHIDITESIAVVHQSQQNDAIPEKEALHAGRFNDENANTLKCFIWLFSTDIFYLLISYMLKGYGNQILELISLLKHKVE